LVDEALGNWQQLTVSMGKNLGEISGIPTFFGGQTTLSERIYKICTLLSTGIVENARRAMVATSRKALPVADFRGSTAFTGDFTDDGAGAVG
jgi:hypothetical protein